MRPIAQLSVAISTRARPDALAACLDALLAGMVWPAELIVVDQSQDDRTHQVTESRQHGLPSLIYVHHAGDGLGASQNLAFARATTPIVAVTDDDCVPTADWVAQIEAVFATDPVDVVTGRVLPLDPPTPGHQAVASRTSSVRRNFSRQAMPWDIGSGNNFAARHEWLERIGGNDERLGPGSPGLGGVDMDLFYRLLRAGARIRYEPAVLVYHARTTREGRLARRFPYGYGMGAGCTLWWRQGDRNALRILVRWLALRAGRAARGLRQGQGQLAYEESLVLAGTIRGLAHGWRA
jgi:O-antigen biosynthesis protein